ncbi:hypothetical protein OIU84_006530 [Salix udensis]|uniref:Uncharacterized protein n=1 Tax=Salix udensis TaxID=889485 RepID=A0AAD6JYR8_9ROSI|nr:hypothetical protein OIU84_006530 [Salix udensis]
MGIESLLATLRRVTRRLNRWFWIPTDDDRVGVAQEKGKEIEDIIWVQDSLFFRNSNVDNLPINKDVSEIEVWFLLQRIEAKGMVTEEQQEHSRYSDSSIFTTFPEMAVKVVLRVKFDHHPVLVDLHYKESKNKTSMPFLFEAGW